MKNLLSFFAVCFLSCSCSAAPKHIELADQVSFEFSKEVCTSENLVLVCMGGELMDDIQKICLGYATVRTCSVPEARSLLVSLIESFLHMINTNEEIRPYLHEFPFTHKNVEMSVRFVDKKGNHMLEPYVSYVFSADERIVYTSYNTQTKAVDIFYREFYDDAVSELTRCEESFSR